MRAFRRIVVGAVVVAVAMAGCGTTRTGPSFAPHGWAEQPATWVHGYDEAFDAGTGEHALYLAADVVVDSTALAEGLHAVGRARGPRVQQQVYSGPVERGELFLGGSGVVRTESWEGDAGPVDVTAWVVIGDDGIRRYEHAVPVAEAAGVETAGLARVLAAYDQAWEGDAGAVHGLYDRAATLVDGIVGIDVVGAAAIADLAAGNSGPGPLAPACEPGSAYVHSGPDGALQVWVPRPRAGPCGSDTVVAVTLDSSLRIVHERRFHALSTVGSCASLPEPDDGWWVGHDGPDAFGERVSGTVRGPSGPVEIRNGGTLWQAVVAWSLDQFPRSGLPAPDVAVVAFDPLDPRCDERCGLAQSGPPATVLICVDAAGLDAASQSVPAEWVPLWPTHLVLHELAHVWVDQHVDSMTRRLLVERLGLPGWDDPTTPWEQRGVEWAAEAIAWGLIDRACTPVALGTPSCAELTATFRRLTGTGPLTSCPTVASQVTSSAATTAAPWVGQSTS